MFLILERYFVNKAELIDEVAAVADLPKSVASKALESVLEVITNTLKGGDDIAITGFGTFTVKARAAREGRNPKTGETIQIAASKAASFKAGKSLKEAVNS